MVLRHGQLRMYSNREVVRSGKDGRGLFVVINGLVRIGYQDPLGNTQEYFLGTGASKDTSFYLGTLILQSQSTGRCIGCDSRLLYDRIVSCMGRYVVSSGLSRMTATVILSPPGRCI